MRKLFGIILLASVLAFTAACSGSGPSESRIDTDTEQSAKEEENIAKEPEKQDSLGENTVGVFAGYALIPMGDEVVRYQIVTNDISGIDLGCVTEDNLIYEWGSGGTGNGWRFYEMTEYPERERILGLGPEGGIFEAKPFLAVTKSEIEAVANSDAVLLVNGSVESGRDVWDAFLGKVNSQSPASVIIGFCYTQNKNMSLDLAVATEGDYPSLFLNKLTYDGSQFILEPVHRIDGEYVVREIEGYDSPKEYYQFLRHFEGEARFPFAIYTYYDKYILTDNDTAAWEEIEDSSLINYDEAIWYTEVYGEYKWKDDAPFLPLQR
ncbi:MAG: hypothetical protein J6X08_03655 [Lachnospiraceae bacterium]|nr:hypothetical protein [Lachnospiraceae bacterium]